MKRIVLSVFIAASFGFGLFADDFVKVEGGEFLMGKSGVQFLESVVDGEKVVKKLTEDNDAYDDEIRHSVKVGDFKIRGHADSLQKSHGKKSKFLFRHEGLEKTPCRIRQLVRCREILQRIQPSFGAS